MNRRTFLTSLIGVLQALLALALMIPGFRAVFSAPRRRERDAPFLRAAPLDTLDIGEPYLATIQAARWDAYVRYPPNPVGRVWLIRESDPAGTEKVRCLQTICPHLGCGINFIPGRAAFACPCHASEFGFDGKSQFGPSPRDMDELECRVGEPDDAGRRWVEVRYREFQPGIAEQREV